MAARERVFQSSSVTSRRFPALRTLTVDDVEVMVVPGASSPKAKAAATATGKHLFDPNLVKPSAVEGIGAVPKKAAKPAASAKPPVERVPFRPCNPTEARESIAEMRHGYVGIHSPYDLAHKLENMERAEAAKHIIGGVYLPNAWSQARKSIEINYFLNSPDAETIEAERRYIQEKAQRNMVEYYRRLRPSGGVAPSS